jgi:hypothetical protein
MTELISLICPSCDGPIAAVRLLDKAPVAKRFEDCLRRCEACGVAASNAAHSRDVTFIYRDPLENIPIESREGAIDALSRSLNVRSRQSKRSRFGFTTSEDALTWVVFTYLLRSGQLVAALQRIELIAEKTPTTAPVLLLWGVPIGTTTRGIELRSQLRTLCASLKEDPTSFSEPDVIIDFGEGGLVFIEVKYRSGNDQKLDSYLGWSRYESAAGMTWQFDEVKASGCYELARNWRLLKGLANDRPATLVNLGPAKLFSGAEGERLTRFINALSPDEHSQFKKVGWSDLLEVVLTTAPNWIVQYCESRFDAVNQAQ